MKIRNGFVSNSSSSSYVIAYKEAEKCPHCGRSDVDIISLIDQREDCSGETSVSAIGYDDVMERLKGWMDDDDDVYKKIDELNDGSYEFAIVYVSYSDETLRDLIKNNPSVKILYNNN